MGIVTVMLACVIVQKDMKVAIVIVVQVDFTSLLHKMEKTHALVKIYVIFSKKNFRIFNKFTLLFRIYMHIWYILFGYDVRTTNMQRYNSIRNIAIEIQIFSKKKFFHQHAFAIIKAQPRLMEVTALVNVVMMTVLANVNLVMEEKHVTNIYLVIMCQQLSIVK